MLPSDPISPDLSAQQAEVQALLASPLFTRAPSLSRFLSYICQRHFSADPSRITEHDIAIHALGRSEPFDQKKDAIVRVEIHRLRKRLIQFYDTDGAHHAYRISIPHGSYSPVFSPALKAPPAPLPAPVPPAAAPLPPQPATHHVPWLWIAAGLAAVALLSTIAHFVPGFLFP